MAVKPGAGRVLAISAGCVGLEVRGCAVYPSLMGDVPYLTCDAGDTGDSARDPQVVSRIIPAASRPVVAAEEGGWTRYGATGFERPGSEDASSESAGSEGLEGPGFKRMSPEHTGWQRADSESVGCRSAWPVSADFVSVPLTSHPRPSVEAELTAEAVAISNRIGGTRFYRRCGEPLSLRSGGWKMLYGCGHTVSPRVNLAATVAVRDAEGRLLLTRNGRWTPGRLSVLAGFVEAGEPLESAVAREVLEKTGAVVDDVVYVTPQPQSFPHSLMPTFEGRTRARQEDVKVNGEGLIFARFFSREEFSGALALGEIGLPTPTLVSMRLIERWLGRSLADAG